MQKSDHLDEYLFSRLKYSVVKLPFSTNDSCLYNNILIQSMNISPNSNFFKIEFKKL